MWVALLCLEPSWTLYILSFRPPTVLLREALFICGASVFLLQSVGTLGTGRRGLDLLEVRTMAGPEIGK